MNSTDILTYSNRLIKGENPIEVFTEIEIFYAIRKALNHFDPGNCRHGSDTEYDSVAQYLLNYIINACENSRVTTSNEFADFLNEYFVKQFGELQLKENIHFSYFLFQYLKTIRLPSDTIRGKNYKSILKMSDYEF